MSDSPSLNFPHEFHHYQQNFVFVELLPAILSNLTTPELLKLRLVNRTWDTEAVRLLMKREGLIISFTFCRHARPPTFIRRFAHISAFYCCHRPDLGDGETFSDRARADPQKRWRTIASFTESILLGPKSYFGAPFFVRRFRFDLSGGILELSEVFQFFRVFGVWIKELHLENYPDYYLGQNGWDTNCILKYTPNLEKLDLMINRTRNQNLVDLRRRSLDEQVKGHEMVPVFHHLKFLEIHSPHSKGTNYMDLTLLLTQAEVLRSVTYSGVRIPSEVISTLVDLGKCHLLQIQYLQINLDKLLCGDFGDLEKLTRVKEGSIKVTRLRLYNRWWDFPLFQDDNANLQAISIWRRTLFCLVTFLDKCKSLEKIILENKMVTLWKNPKFLAILPQIRNVSEIVFTCTEPDSVFRASLQNDIGPNWNYQNLPVSVFENFPAVENRSIADIFPDLKKVEISWDDGRLPPLWFPFWGDVFPTVKSLVVTFPCRHGPSVFSKLPATFPTLEKLEVQNTANEFVAHVEELGKFEHLGKLQLTIVSRCWPTRKKEQDLPEYLWFQQIELFPIFATLLGIKKEDFRKGFENWEKSGRWNVTVDESSDCPSIFNLTNLTCLHVDLRKFDGKLAAFVAGLIGQLSMQKRVDLAVFFNVKGIFLNKAEENAFVEEYSAPISRQFANVHFKTYLGKN